MSKPASETTIKNLSDNMGDIINIYFPLLKNCIKGLNKLENIQKADCLNYRKILELHSYVLYVTIEVACAFRADFHSNLPIEKKVNLKYIILIISEFFKSVFILKKNGRSLWEDVSAHLSDVGIDVTKFNIKESVDYYENVFYNNDKINRDIAAHYDFDLIKLYEYLVNISEEKEAQRLCDFMAIIQPLNILLLLYSSIIISQLQAEDTSKLLETDFEHILFKKLKEKSYPSIDNSLQHFSELLDKNMRTYCFIEKLSNEIKSMLGNSVLERIKAMRDYTKVTIILHYIYLDLGTAIRGYFQSESYIEKRWNIIRINLIIYEGWKKIYLQQPNKEKSLWEQYIYIPLSLIDDESIKKDVDSINSLLNSYKEYKSIENIRNIYVHKIERKKNNLPILFYELLKLNPYDELNKSLDFFKLLPCIIKLNMKSMHIAYEAEKNSNREKRQEQFNSIKSLISVSNMSKEKKKDLLKIIENEESKIMSLFN